MRSSISTRIAHQKPFQLQAMMRLRKSLILLPLISIAVILSHISWIRDDLGFLLTVDDRPIDVSGNIENRLNQWTRSCSAVTQLNFSNDKYLLAKNLIYNYSPPDSSNMKIASAWSMGEWILVEVEFKNLLPAVVMIQNSDSAPEIVPDAVWSGYTNPHVPAPFIRKFLTERLKSPPYSLIHCFEPQSKSFK